MQSLTESINSEILNQKEYFETIRTSIFHDLNGPLNNIFIQFYLLKKDRNFSEKNKQKLQYLESRFEIINKQLNLNLMSFKQHRPNTIVNISSFLSPLAKIDKSFKFTDTETSYKHKLESMDVLEKNLLLALLYSSSVNCQISTTLSANIFITSFTLQDISLVKERHLGLANFTRLKIALGNKVQIDFSLDIHRD